MRRYASLLAIAPVIVFLATTAALWVGPYMQNPFRQYVQNPIRQFFGLEVREPGMIDSKVVEVTVLCFFEKGTSRDQMNESCRRKAEKEISTRIEPGQLLKVTYTITDAPPEPTLPDSIAMMGIARLSPR